jgi:hypothetical protein
MTVDFGAGFKALAAGFAAHALTARRDSILAFVDKENPIVADALKSAIEKAEPGGLAMALVARTLNKILDGLEDEERAVLPTTVEALFDWCVAKLNAVSQSA